MAAYSNKFIAFVDILGFKQMVEASAKDESMLDRLIEMTDVLGIHSELSHHEVFGPITCPCAPYIQKDLDFRVTQISDCVVISSEISPSGLINLVSGCWKISVRLLQSGILCRGFVTAGKVYHTESQIIGPAYQAAYESESTVTAFRRMADEKGTPFIELDDEVSRYVADQKDECVKTMFERFTSFDGSKYAVFPFKALDHEFSFGGASGEVQYDEDRRGVDVIRGWIADMKRLVLESCEAGGPRAAVKAQHYLDALDRQLVELDRIEEMILFMQQPAVRMPS